MEGRRSIPGTRRPWWVLAVRGASGLAVASAVSAATAADGPRAAVLLAPRVGAPAAVPVVARGVADDDPLATSPVVRRGGPAPLRPLVPPSAAKTPTADWLSGVDPNVVPAGGNVPSKGAAPIRLSGDPRTAAALPPAGSPKLAPPPPLFQPGDPRPLAKGVEAMKGFVTPDAAAAADARSPGDPLRGTAANGAPVLAGPPAWRWYGYGSVTPGANAYAPTGQYPRASSNWYSVTRATPGAFPVPVVAPFRSAPGSEPPSYAGGSPAPTRPAPAAFQPTPAESAIAPTPRFNPTPFPAPATPAGTRTGPAPVTQPAAAMPPPVVPIPTMTPVAAAPPALAPIPLPPPPSLLPLPSTRAPEPVAVAPPPPLPTAEPPAAPRPMTAPPILPPLSVMPVATAIVPTPATAPPTQPAPVPTTQLPTIPSVAPSAAPSAAAPAAAADEIRWQSNPTYRPGPAPGTWLPPADRARSVGQPGASLEPRPIVARGQIGDEVQPPPQPADPVESVVQAVCRGRATGIEVRHTGPRRVAVCFEARTQTDATALVRDLSARPELAPYEINFCVLVK